MVILTLIQQMPRWKKGNECVCMYVCVCLFVCLFDCLFVRLISIVCFSDYFHFISFSNICLRWFTILFHFNMIAQHRSNFTEITSLQLQHTHVLTLQWIPYFYLSDSSRSVLSSHRGRRWIRKIRTVSDTAIRVFWLFHAIALNAPLLFFTLLSFLLSFLFLFSSCFILVVLLSISVSLPLSLLPSFPPFLSSHSSSLFPFDPFSSQLLHFFIHLTPLHSYPHRSTFFFTPPFFRSFFSPSLHSYPLASLLLITPLLFSPLNRLWTRGYDVYTPSRNLIGHDYLSTMTATAPKLVDKEHFDELSPLEWARWEKGW